MALNPCRFLGEIAHDSKLTEKQIKHALSYSQVGDCLDYDDWNTLHETEGIGALRDAAFEMLPRYWQQWEVLGKPRTAEEWLTAAYATAPASGVFADKDAPTEDALPDEAYRAVARMRNGDEGDYTANDNAPVKREGDGAVVLIWCYVDNEDAQEAMQSSDVFADKDAPTEDTDGPCGHCDQCGAPCDERGCTQDITHRDVQS